MHLHAYSVPGVRVVPDRGNRQDWEPEEALTEVKPAVEWLAAAMRELTGQPDMSLDDEARVWTTTLTAGESVHTGAKGTALLMEAWPDCECHQDAEASVAQLRRGRRR
jgi:hypothetical protein